MLLKDIIACENKKLAETEITGITCDSRELKAGYVFVCIQGTESDGHSFAEAAAEKGAAIIIAEKDTGLKNQLLVENTHIAYADMCSRWFGNPSHKLRLIGVTGTNGKTSTTYMIKSILEAAGHKVGLIGTIQNTVGERVIVSHNTTPDAYALNSLFSLMVAEGCDFAVMEISSHALAQYRVYGLDFEIAVFTNLTQDHLDYHKTMDNYLAAKKKLFSMCRTAVINTDDPHSAEIVDGCLCKKVTYSVGDGSEYSAKAIKYQPAGVDYELVCNSGIQHIKVHTGGKFTVYNSLAAAVTALELGINMRTVSEALEALRGVKGRAEAVPCDSGFTVIIDYAHTPDGLKNILSTFRECRKNRLIAVFGCGGDRDRTKRSIMGNIAVHNSDVVIITSDNPRSENPMDIISDILEGTSGSRTPVKVIENRIEAIRYAIAIAKPDDIIVLAGKGHETYQILNSGTVHLDEREVIAEALEDLKNGRLHI